MNNESREVEGAETFHRLGETGRKDMENMDEATSFISLVIINKKFARSLVA